jgi:hypothetical protein
VSSPPWDGGPYAGPPQYVPPAYSPPPYGPPPQYGPPPGWGWSPYPARPQRPGPVIAAAVLVFASALLVLVGTVYAMAFSALLSLARGPDAGVGPVVALLQLALAGLLVVGGLRVLHRDRWWLLGAAAGQLAMTVYWLAVLHDVAPPTVDDTVLVLPLLYGALALVAAGLTFLPDARAWTSRDDGA